MTRIVAVCFIALAVSASAAPAQHVLEHGERIRVTSTSGDVTRGTFERSSPEGVTVLVPGVADAYVIPSGDIRAVETSLGQRTRFWKYFGIGVATTALGGGVVTAAAWQPCRDTGFLSCLFVPETRTGAFGQGLVVGGIVGVPIGVLVGLFAREERWAPIDFPGGQQASFSVVPEASGAAVRVRLASAHR